MKTLLCLLGSAALLTTARAEPIRADEDNVPCDKVESIGAAKMGDDRVITMRIHSLPPGPIAERQFKSSPSSKDYVELFNHLGGIVPGQTKSVKPWCY